jgi:alcohol dehydrogenase (cytochrome c)
MKKRLQIIPVVISATLLAAGCTSTDKEKDPVVEKETTYGNWESFGYDYGLGRHVPYDQITKDNVKDLGLVWNKNFKELNKDIPSGNQSYPIVIDGVAYVTTSSNYVFAFDAVKGDVIWQWKPDQETLEHIKKMQMPSSNRGVAVGEGKVFMLIADNQIVAIDQKTGKTVKQIKISDYYPEVTAENGYYETTAPVYYDGKIFVGSSGGDNGIRGFEAAFKASDLTPAWDEPFYTVPPKGQDWLAEGLFGGGGAVWMPPSVDPETGLMYISTGNPAPDYYGESRPGDNPHTDSVVALDSKTGKMVWAQQQVSHDLWDYDTADSPSIVTAKINGKEQKIVMVGTKGGEWFAYDAKSGNPIYKNVAFSKIDHPAPTPEGVLTYPGVLGGQNYAPDTFDPAANLTLIPGIEQPYITKSAKNEAEAADMKDKFFGIWAMGTSFAVAADTEAYGTITAIDLNDGKIKYQIKTDDPMRGGLTSTKTGLSFYGELGGTMKAIETSTGKELWSFQTSGDTISAAPTIFEKDNKTYVMITSAGNQPQIHVFALGGDKTQATPKK